MMVPMIMMVAPINIILRLPSRSPMKNALMAPKKAPTS
jgi:hypothetical protein